MFAIAIALAIAVGGWVWRANEVRMLVAAHRPELPGVSRAPEELSRRLVDAERRARSLTDAQEGLAELARLLHANGFFEEALRCYQGLQRAQPTEARWWHLAASLLAHQGQLEEAEPLFRGAMERAPDYGPARLRLGDVLLKNNRADEARKVYQEVLGRTADEPYALLGLARCAIAAGEWEIARERLLASVAANPDFIGGMSLLATVHEHFGNGEEAAALRARVNRREFVDFPDAWLDALIDECYDPYQLSVAAAVAHFRGEDEVAIRRLERAAALARAPAPYYRQLGKLLSGLGNAVAARSKLEQAVALAPTDADAWVLLVNLLLTEGNRAEAYRKVATGIAHCPDSWALHFAHGRMLHEDGRLPGALGELHEAKRLRPSEANPYVELALVRFKLGDVEAGVAEMREALSVQPDQPLALVVVARDAISKGDRAASRDWIRRLRRQTRVGREDLQMVLGEFQRQFGEPAE